MENYSATNVKSWLSVALEKENFAEFSVEVVGSSEKGDGFIGDVIFVLVTGTDQKGIHKEYNLALKCSKASPALKEQMPGLGQVFEREFYMYEKVFPSFRQFQLDRGIEEPFDSVPKCYGVFNSDEKQVIALENLRKIGYTLWDATTPLSKEHVDLVIQEYAKFHAISVAMREQEPEKFLNLLDGLRFDIFGEIFKMGNFLPIIEKCIDEISDLLKADLDTNTLQKWLNYKNHVNSIFFDLSGETNELNVIAHDDCWNNNFMYKYQGKDKSSVSRVAILDWQASRYVSSIVDLSYFLFACIAPEEMNNLHTILKNYYDFFMSYLSRLGTNFHNQCSFEHFMQEWKKRCKFGIMICLMPLKLSYADKENIPDIAKSAENGGNLVDSFTFNMSNYEGYKTRMKSIVEYAVKLDLV